MKKYRRNVLWLLISLLIFFTAAACPAEEYEYIDIRNPFLRKIPVAVPVFQAMAGTESEKKVSVESADMLAGALEFTGYFKILDRGAFLEYPHQSGITSASINFKNWTTIGSELLVTGGVYISDNIVEIELRLFDTFKGQLLVGKRYKGWMADQRNMIHRFCNEVIFRLTGTWGIFESKIAFLSNGSGNKEIFICDFDGYRPEQWTNNKKINLFPAWSSDGNWIAYTSYRNNKPDLYIENLSEKRGYVVDKEGINTSPAWVPGQFALAATLSFSGDPEIYLLTGAGKIIKRITNSWGIDESPSWSPDGKKLAFVSSRAGSPQIYVQDIQSGKVDRLTFRGNYNTQPAWSPKGDQIAYTASESGVNNICVMGLDGGGPVQLTRDAGNNESATWSPDGSLIAFSSTREGPSRIYVMTAYGTDQRRLLTLPGEQSGPRWSPSVITK